jgi:hypothetical protein
MEDYSSKELTLTVIQPIIPEVEYFSAIICPIRITNTSSSWILLEDITLRFESDPAPAALHIKTEWGKIIGPGETCTQNVEIIPTPLYRESTNMFDVRVRYRSMSPEGVGGRRRAKHDHASCIIVRNPKKIIGRVFISLKQPDDLALGRLMETMARRAGFEPFLKDNNQRLSEDIWVTTIEPALRSSHFCIVIWTDHTDWDAVGVEREIAICRDAKISEALFLEHNLAVPDLYDGSSIEWTLFDIPNAGFAFSEGLSTLRQIILGDVKRDRVHK